MPNKLVLIVEDEPDNREIMRNVVADIMGYEVALAADSGEFMQQIEIATRSPDLILLDLDSAVLNGLEAIRFVRESPAKGGIPIIAISALSGPPARALAVGASDYISKPLDRDVLAAKVAAQLSAD